MALWFALRVNGDTIGTFSATRREATIPADRICTYDVEFATPHAITRHVVTHNYDHGAVALVATALAAIEGKASEDVR